MEIHAAVEAAENWGTYFAVHVYTPRAMQQAISAGVKCIEHGHLVDETTAKLMAEKGIWWSLQPFLDDEDAIAFPEGSANRKKELQVFGGTDNAYALAKKYKIKTARGHGHPVRCKACKPSGRPTRQTHPLVYACRNFEDGNDRQRGPAGHVGAT